MCLNARHNVTYVILPFSPKPEQQDVVEGSAVFSLVLISSLMYFTVIRLESLRGARRPETIQGWRLASSNPTADSDKATGDPDGFPVTPALIAKATRRAGHRKKFRPILKVRTGPQQRAIASTHIREAAQSADSRTYKRFLFIYVCDRRLISVTPKGRACCNSHIPTDHLWVSHKLFTKGNLGMARLENKAMRSQKASLYKSNSLRVRLQPVLSETERPRLTIFQLCL